MDIEIKKNFEIKKYTTFKIGGTVKCLYLPQNQTELVYLLNTLDNYILLGNCSNVLFSSDGYNGNIILTEKMNNYFIRGNQVIAECGVKGQTLSKAVSESCLSGFEFMIGFPGSIGGEIYMNASAHGQSVSDTLTRCCVYDCNTHQVLYIDKSELAFGYRTSIFQKGRYILLGAEFDLKKKSKTDIEDWMTRNISSRRNIQPTLANPNAGSVFKNPPNDSAGRLLEKAGVKHLKGHNCKVWEKHANFIINTSDATSEDILELMLQMYTAVKEMFTIELSPEIIYVGDKNKKEEQICKILYQKKQK